MFNLIFFSSGTKKWMDLVIVGNIIVWQCGFSTPVTCDNGRSGRNTLKFIFTYDMIFSRFRLEKQIYIRKYLLLCDIRDIKNKSISTCLKCWFLLMMMLLICSHFVFVFLLNCHVFAIIGTNKGVKNNKEGLNKEQTNTGFVCFLLCFFLVYFKYI